jgi:hypothetical protein
LVRKKVSCVFLGNRAVLYAYPAMHVTLFKLRLDGRPLGYGAIKARPALTGRLVYGTWTDPATHARLFDEDGRPLAEMRNASVKRISGGCVLLQGFEPGPNTPMDRQTWLCALDPESGDAALRKIRKPSTADQPLGDWSDDPQT